MTTLIAHLPLTDIGLALAIFAIGAACGFAVARALLARSK